MHVRKKPFSCWHALRQCWAKLGGKKQVMTPAVKDVLYGAITELMRNPKFFTVSAYESKYSSWTAEGLLAVTDLINTMTTAIHQSEVYRSEQIAKEITMRELKKP